MIFSSENAFAGQGLCFVSTNCGAVSTKQAVTVGENSALLSGKETESRLLYGLIAKRKE